jgi:hypothetical protein
MKTVRKNTALTIVALLVLVLLSTASDYPDASVEIKKYVSADGITWWDADTLDQALDVPVGSDVYFRLVVTNTGNQALRSIELSDSDYDVSGCVIPDVLRPVSGPEGQFACEIGPFEAMEDCHVNIATVSDFKTGPATDVAYYCGPPPPPPPGDEGCTPGFWKNPKRLPLWQYNPGDDFDATFSVDYFDPDITLGDAIGLGGGGYNKLARHGTAALLNAAHPEVDYPLTVDEVIAIVQDGGDDAEGAADYLEGYNVLLAEGFCE